MEPLQRSRVPSYDERALLVGLTTGLSYDDLSDRYGLDPLDADRVIADLRHSYEIVRRKAERGWVWALGEDPFDALEEGL